MEREAGYSLGHGQTKTTYRCADRRGLGRVAWLEQVTDELTSEIELPPQFILPGETVPGAALDVARTVVRRGERHAVALQREGLLANEQILRYLNRLSSLLFILARFEEQAAGTTATRAKANEDRSNSSRRT